MKLSRYGDRALRLEVDDLAEVHRWTAALRAVELAGVRDIVPGWGTVTVLVDDSADLAVVEQRVPTLSPKRDAGEARRHIIPVSYDGDDLDRVASHAGVSPADVIEGHCAATYTVAFLGFTPGFPYLDGLDPRLAVPRLETPRVSVAAGSVGIADDTTGIYPSASPGGWNIIGRTEAVLFDASHAPPALLEPGDFVRFEPV